MFAYHLRLAWRDVRRNRGLSWAIFAGLTLLEPDFGVAALMMVVGLVLLVRLLIARRRISALVYFHLVTAVVGSWPGLGRLTFGAILARDFPLILGTVAVSAILVISGNLAADVLHALSDPRVRDA
mgnify:CR=1 FL=1